MMVSMKRSIDFKKSKRPNISLPNRFFLFLPLSQPDFKSFRKKPEKKRKKRFCLYLKTDFSSDSQIPVQPSAPLNSRP